MTPRELMLEKVVSTNRKYNNLFILTISTDGDEPVIQGFYENDPAEDGDDPMSLQIGAQIIDGLLLTMLGEGRGKDEDGGSNGSGEGKSSVH